MTRRVTPRSALPGPVVLAAGRSSGRAGAVPVVRHDLIGDQLLMDLAEFAVNGLLALQVLAVQPFDQLMSWLPPLEVRVVAVAEVELAARCGVVAEPPAAWLVAVVFLDQLVHGGTDRAQDAELFQVGAEPGPEPVIRAGLVDDARVHLEPVIEEPRVLKPDAQARYGDTYQAGNDDRTPLHLCHLRVRARCRPGPAPRDGSGGDVLPDRVQGLAGPAQLNAHRDLRDAVDQGEQAEQQGKGDRADAGAGEEQDAEQDGHQATDDEQRAGAGGLPALEGGEDLKEAADERPGCHDYHQYQRGGLGPHQGDHT